jgi:hypothetical protein
MPHKKKKIDPDDPKPLNFDHDEERGPSDHLKGKRQFSPRLTSRGRVRRLLRRSSFDPVVR